MKYFTLILFVLLGTILARASNATPFNHLTSEMLSQLRSQYTGAEIQIAGEMTWVGQQVPFTFEKIRFLSDDGQGLARFEVLGALGESQQVRAEVLLPFRAEQEIWIAKNRIRPGVALSSQDFYRLRVDAARGKYRQFRGLLLGSDLVLENLETQLTLLEGMPPLTTMVRKIPDVRNGESRKVILQIGENLLLSTSGVVQESGYVGSIIKVMASTQKRILSGVLQNDGSIIVQM